MRRGLVLFMCIILIFGSVNLQAYCKEQEVGSLHAHAGILLDRKSGRILWSMNPHEERAMASTTKIMTSMIAIEYGDLNSIVTVSKKASLAPPVKMGIKPGEKYVLKDLLHALMLESSNDVAVAIAEHIGGNVETFCNMMTIKARELGAFSTTYKTPNGLDAQGHQTTAYDLAIIADYALSNNVFTDIINTPQYVIKKVNGSKNITTVYNKNSFLNSYSGAYGVKTGFTSKAGYCFVGAARQGDMDLISVVLASGWPPQRNYKFTDSRKIMDYGFKNYDYENLLRNAEGLKPIAVIKGVENKVNVTLGDTLIVPMKDSEDYKVSYRLAKSIKAPVEAGDLVGRATVTIGGEYYKTLDITVTGSVEKQTVSYNLKKLLGKWLSPGAFFSRA